MLQTSSSPCASQTRIPRTPMRRFLCRLELFRPNLALGKRSREQEHPSFNKETCTPTTSEAELAGLNSSVDAGQDESQGASVHDEKAVERARLAFQLHDRPLDAVVVTTLPRYPFVRHEELLTMSRQQLVEVAILFNAHLPRTIQIDHSDGVTASHIRHCIETLVGLIPNVPGAPKASKSRSAQRDLALDVFVGDESVDIIPSPPTSPLAMRLTKRQGLAHLSTSSGLESLEEEDEDDLFTRTRALKRRKLSDATEASTRSVYETDSMDVTPIRALKLSPKSGTSPSPDIWSPQEDRTRNPRMSPYTAQSHGRSKNRSKSKGRHGLYLKAPSPSGALLSVKDIRDEEVMSLAMSGLGSTSFYSCANDDDKMDIS